MQIAHGLAEHSARYARLAAALDAQAMAPDANDLRGDRPKAAAGDLGLCADEDGWAKGVGDLWSLNRHSRPSSGRSNRLPRPFAGLVPGRQFVRRALRALAGATYFGSNGQPPPIATLGRLIARAEGCASATRQEPGHFPDVGREFNNPFQPARTLSTGSRATRKRSTPMSPIRCAASCSRPSSRSTSSTRCLASQARRAWLR